MNIIANLREAVEGLSAWCELDVEASELPAQARRLSDESVVDALTKATALANDAARMQAVLAGVVAQRSGRDTGNSGIAATHGHSTPVGLVQSITGGTKADAIRHIRVGTSLLDDGRDGGADAAPTDPHSPGAQQPAPVHVPWHEPLRRALLTGAITSSQHDAIRGGLGEPRVLADDASNVGVSPSTAAVEEAWMLAAECLIEEAPAITVEELAMRARTMRDLLDPVGAEERYQRRFEKRSFRMWVDAEGQHRAHIAFDDEMALWVRSLRDAALRPRRGGPRFITDEERAAADELIADPRTNEQLEYDLLMDVLRAGALADAKDVFGARQPGVRMIVVKDAAGPRDAFGRLVAVGHAEDGGDPLPGSVIDRNLCINGSIEVQTDRLGNPLDLGREQRLFSTRQRVALAARDGGCRWPGCQRPASYCESHHCDHFVEHEGRTDIDRGILLCRWHHLLLHNQGWRITRDKKGPFVLHPPPGEGPPIVLESKAAWKWAWDPPPPPQRAGWRAA